VADEAYVASSSGLYEIDVSVPEEARVVEHFSSVGDARDVTVWGDLVLVAADSGLFVIERHPTDEDQTELILVAGPIDTGSSRSVFVTEGLAFVGAHEGLSIVDLSTPADPVVLETIGAPFVNDLRDVVVFGASVPFIEVRQRFKVVALSRSTIDQLDGGVTTLDIDENFALADWRTLALPEANRIDWGGTGYNFDLTAVATELGVRTLNYDFSFSLWIDVAGANGVSMEYRTGQAGVVYVSANDGLYRYEYWTQNGWVFSGFFDSGLSRDVFIRGENAFVATDRGLFIVRACV
jgi:hypothetical protein